jgi:hypothetical protein
MVKNALRSPWRVFMFLCHTATTTPRCAIFKGCLNAFLMMFTSCVPARLTAYPQLTAEPPHL